MSITLDSEVKIVNQDLAIVVPPEKYAEFSNLWIDRQGVAYKVYDDEMSEKGCYGHWDFAHQAMGLSEGTYALEDRGWIHLSCGTLMCYKRGLTRKQKEFIVDWAIEWGHDSSNIDDLISDLEDINMEWNPERVETARKHLNIND